MRSFGIRFAILLTVSLFAALTDAAHALPAVAITQVQQNDDSVRVYFQPFPGAADYRGYAVNNPTEVKYAGLIHLFAPAGRHWAVGTNGALVFPYRTAADAGATSDPTRLDVPQLNIELNGLDPGVPVAIVIEAVDRLGPSPFSNLATVGNEPISPHKDDKKSMSAVSRTADQSDNDAMELLGSNAGPTDDGLYSINGQGGPHVQPMAIARSLPVTVRPTGIHALPSVPDATQVVFDTFEQGSIDEIAGTRNVQDGRVSYLMHSDAEWRLDFFNDDIIHSRPFLMNLHFMDVLFDGGTPGSSDPLHIQHGVMTMSLVRPADFSGGRVLHVTMEVDSHVDGRRWVGINLTPCNDPLQNLYISNRPINKSNTGMFVQVAADTVATDLFEGKLHVSLAGAAGQAVKYIARPSHDGYDGRGLDNRSRFDLYVSAQRYRVFENGEIVIDQSFPEALPAAMQKVKVYYSHYLYHTGNEVNDIKTYRPWEDFWLTLFPYSDERHWDNMGYEVLPASYANISDDALGRIIRASKSVKIEQAAELMAAVQGRGANSDARQ
jgi:hypothetical protein